MHTVKYKLFIAIALIFYGAIANDLANIVKTHPQIIIAGIGGGGLLLGTHKNVLYNLIGKPDSIKPASNIFNNSNTPFNVDNVLYYKDLKYIICMYDNRVSAIIFASKGLITYKGIKIGDNIDKVAAQYGLVFAKQGQDMIYKHLGIAFFIQHLTVAGIAVFFPIK